jgi:hypothetical protein
MRMINVVICLIICSTSNAQNNTIKKKDETHKPYSLNTDNIENEKLISSTKINVRRFKTQKYTHTHTHRHTDTDTDTDNVRERDQARKRERETPVSLDQDGLGRQQLLGAVPVSIRQHTSAYVIIRHHTS